MKKDKDLKIVIIGMGNIMEIIFHCLENAVGKNRLAQQITATTADKADRERKEKVFGIPVILNDNLTPLKQVQPDIIFFAPPPSVAPAILNGELKDYFEFVRSSGNTLPEIYAFPPVPGGSEYQKVLGEDVLVANIIPNNINKIKGKKTKREGFYSYTFSSSWPGESKDRLNRIFAPSGEGIELKPDELVPMLGGYVTILSLLESLPSMADHLKINENNITHQNLGNYMRAKVQQNYGYCPAESDPCATDTIPESLKPFLDSTITAWHEGINEYFNDVKFPEKAASIILTRGIELILHVIQMESREVIRHHAVAAATKGGVLEKGINCFHELIEPVLQTAVHRLSEQPNEKWTDLLRQKVRETAHLVCKHGMTLAR